jgi:hypothetical protein
MNRMKRILEIEKGFTQISLITQIKYENRYGMNRIIWILEIEKGFTQISLITQIKNENR